MRDSIFKAKSIVSGEWVYGAYYSINDIGYIIKMCRYVPDTRDWDVADYYDENPEYSPNEIKVDASTASEYTGLKDAKGNMIFEGDILESTSDKTFLFAVRYGEYGDRNDESKKHIGFYCDWISCHGLNQLNGLAFNANKYKVIGNIYDNPEFLR